MLVATKLSLSPAEAVAPPVAKRVARQASPQQLERHAETPAVSEKRTSSAEENPVRVETKPPAPDRTDETTVCRLLQQTPAAQPALRAKDDPGADDPNTIVRLLLDTARLACNLYDRALRAQLPGMTLGRCGVLIQLAQHKGLNQAALAQILDIRPITLVRLLDRLEAAGFVERIPDPDDRRAHVLALTTKALPIIQRIQDLNRTTCDDLHLGVSETEATQLHGLLTRIRSELMAARLNDDPPNRLQAQAARSPELADCHDRVAGDLAKGGKEPA
jgi:MarR family transcriptional regulator, transcriptional regulator for hemolysin